jgi:hypothetical protein
MLADKLRNTNPAILAGYVGVRRGEFRRKHMKANSQATQHELKPRQIAYQIDQRQPSDVAARVLWVAIPYTTPELTAAALRHAAVCTDLAVHVVLIDVQVVPFPCPLEQPPINREFSAKRLGDLFGQTELPGRCLVCYARDWVEGFRRTLDPESLVVLPTKKRWFRTREEKLAEALKKAGHQVMLLRV